MKMWVDHVRVKSILCNSSSTKALIHLALGQNPEP